MPTIKQRKAVRALGENGGIVSTAMIEAGYSPKTAKNPDKLTESDGFRELTKKFLPDDLLMKVHMQGLQATRSDSAGQQVDDFQARHKYLDSAYKLKGLYAPEMTHNMNINVNATPDSLSKFDKLRTEYEEKLLKEIAK